MTDKRSTFSNKSDLKKSLFDEMEKRLTDIVKKEIVKYKQDLVDSSSEDSAYQAALELGSSYYSKHKSERSKHRNFRKCK